MDADAARDFIRKNHHAVLATYRADGSPQMSPVAADVDPDGLIVVSTRSTHRADDHALAAAGRLLPRGPSQPWHRARPAGGWRAGDGRRYPCGRAGASSLANCCSLALMAALATCRISGVLR